MNHALWIGTKDVPEQTVLRVRMRSAIGGIPAAMGVAFGELMGQAEAGGIAVTGPPMCVYAEEPSADAEAEFWVCLPVAPGSRGSGRVEATVLPATTVAWTIHRGHHEKLQTAHGELMAWVQEQGRLLAGSFAEIYLTDPQAVQPEEYLTEIRVPLDPGRSEA